MSGRGRGRGRGGWGGGRGMMTYAREMEFELFPEDVTLPSNKVNHDDTLMKDLLRRNARLQNYWKASPYLIEETEENKRMHVERFSDRNKTTFTRDSLSQILVFKEFPKELVRGTATARRPSRKRFRWNPESGIKRIDFFEQLEKKNQVKEGKDEKENKGGENEEEKEEEENVDDEEVEEEEEFGDDDYHQNEYFDDDEDDYNDADEGDDEGTY